MIQLSLFDAPPPIRIVSSCCYAEMIPPDEDMAEQMGSMWRAYTCYICKKCGKACKPVDVPHSPNIIKPLSKDRCRNCIHLTRHFYNKGFKYCKKQRSKLTANGLKKIGSNDPACMLFEKK